MLSSQRLIVITIALYVILGMVGQFMSSPSTYQHQAIDNATRVMEGYHNEAKKDTSLWSAIKDSATQLYDKTIGVPIKWGQTLIDPFIKLMMPVQGAETQDEQLQQEALRYLNAFRSFLLLLTVVEIYLLIVNKKVT